MAAWSGCHFSDAAFHQHRIAKSLNSQLVIPGESMSSVPTQPDPATASQPTNLVKLRLLPWSIASEAFNAVFSQLTFWGAPFVLFFSELNLSNSAIGFVFSLLPFFGLIAIFVAPAIARAGYKRIYVSFFSVRKLITLLLLFVPWINVRFDGRFTLTYLTIVFMLFALVRAVAVTAYFPWRQEYVPNSIQGKYAATNNLVAQLTSLATVSFASYIVSQSDDINRFTFLIAIAVIFGGISAFCASRIPGGAPRDAGENDQSGLKGTLSVLSDGNFRVYLLGLGVVTFAVTPEATFVPLFMQREAGLTVGQVVLLQNGVLLGGLASTFFWGWASDRFGSKPIILSSLYLQIVLLIGWLLIPRNTTFTLYIALALAALQGIIAIAWVIGAGRLLYVRIVPPEQKAEYMAVYYAVLGLFGGLSQLIGGQLIDLTEDVSGQIAGIAVTPFTPLFGLSLLLVIFGLVLFHRVSADNNYSFGEFAGMFVQGNPVGALSSVVRYHRAPTERRSVAATAYIGRANSRFAIDELLDALKDPRYNVRYEAIIAMARMRSEPRIIAALQEVVTGTELSLTGPAIWALARLSAHEALPVLRQTLEADYASIRASGARALGTLRDRESEAKLLEQLAIEDNIGSKMAYASALGNLRSRDALPHLLQMLETTRNVGARREITLAVVRIVGSEQQFVHLLRQERSDLGTAMAQSLLKLRRQLAPPPDLLQLLNWAIDDFAANDQTAAVAELSKIIAYLADVYENATLNEILSLCSQNFSAGEQGELRPELIVLAVHVLQILCQ